jgi:hypothetical protein
MRLFLLASSLSFALVATAAADPDVAPETTPAAAPPAATTPPATEEPKESPSLSPEAKPKPDAKERANEIRKTTDTYFKQCIGDWDAATHMSRKEWERTCRRVVQNRVKFMLDQPGK